APNNARILNNYGAFLLEQQRYSEALTYFTKASEDTFYGERSRVFDNLGLTYQKLDRPEEARASFERALRLNSRQRLALLEMARIESERDNSVLPGSCYVSVRRPSAQNASGLWLREPLAGRFNDPERAASYALQLRRLSPATPEARALA